MTSTKTQNYNLFYNTIKSFEEFENDFNKAKEEGDSDLDAIEWSK